MAQSRFLATSLFADIVGYTDLMQRDEAYALKILDRFKSSLEKEIPNHNGEIIQYFGDGCLAIFQSTLAAVTCARKLQDQWSQTDRLPVRIGLHSGDVIRKDHNVYGDSVNIASRIESMGIPHSILISESVRNNIKNQPELRFQSLGKYAFKNVNEPIIVYAVKVDNLAIPNVNSITGKFAPKDKKKPFILKQVAIPVMALLALFIIGYFAIWPESKPAETLASSIAVLPFTNLSQDATQDYLTAGFTAEVNHQLSKIESLSVISQTIAKQLVSESKSTTEIAKELKVNYILEGTIQKAGDRTRLITNLTRMTDNQLIWSEEFDLNEVNLIDAQIQVSTGIAEQLPLGISSENFSKLQKIPTTSTLAYEFYLKALDSFNEWVALPKSYEPTIRYLDRAISLDADFGEAYAMLARVYQNSSRMVGADYTLQSQKSLEYANKAIELDSLLPDPYVVIGQIYNDRESGSGLKWLAKANQIDPKSGLFELFQYHYERGELLSAFEYAALKVEKDPQSPYGYIGIAEVHNVLGNYARSSDILEELVSQGFTNSYVTGNLINTYIVSGRPDNAIRIVEDYLMPKDSIAGIREIGIILLFAKKWEEAETYYLRTNNKDMDLALIHKKTGREESADTIFEAAIERREAIQTNTPWHLRDLSRIYAAKGDFEKAYEYLDVLEQRWGDLHYDWIDKDPFFDIIRNERKFLEYRKRIMERKSKLRSEIKNVEKNVELKLITST